MIALSQSILGPYPNSYSYTETLLKDRDRRLSTAYTGPHPDDYSRYKDSPEIWRPS